MAKADWSDSVLLSAMGDRVLPIVEQRGRVRGEMVDDTGISNKACTRSVSPGSITAKSTGVPNDVVFQTKLQIGLVHISAGVATSVPNAPVLADARYGSGTAFRDGITKLGPTYVIGLESHTSL